MIRREYELETLRKLLSRHPVVGIIGARLDVIHSGDHTFPLRKNVRAVAFGSLLEHLQPLR